MLTEAIILAGGLAKRMNGSLKWATRIGNTTLDQLQLNWLRTNGIQRVYVTINEIYKPLYEIGMVKFIWEEKPIGDEGGLKRALEYVQGNEALVINCDVLTDLPLSRLPPAPAFVVVHPRSPWGVLRGEVVGQRDISPRNIVFRLEEKPVLTELLVSAGIYRFPKSIRSELADEGEIARGIVPKLMAEKRLNIFPWEGKWMAIESLKDIEEAEEFVVNHCQLKQTVSVAQRL